MVGGREDSETSVNEVIRSGEKSERCVRGKEGGDGGGELQQVVRQRARDVGKKWSERCERGESWSRGGT